MESFLVKIFHFPNKLSMVSSPLVKREPWSFPLPLIKIYLYFLRDLPHGMVLNNYFLETYHMEWSSITLINSMVWARPLLQLAFTTKPLRMTPSLSRSCFTSRHGRCYFTSRHGRFYARIKFSQ